MSNKDRELLMCHHCKGVGTIYWDELVNHHKGEYDTHSKTCDLCNGSGRVIKTIETITTIEPYTPENWGKKWW